MSTWATPQDMAARLRISERTVRAKVAAGEWEADRIGRLIRFSPDQQDQIAASIAHKQAPKRQASRIREALRRAA